ncbi:MAG: peptidoglycan DD-metalloendopeptidase family protein [Rhodobacteraceae bacterium]|nr:peptidoglycan DD-metalloendopeptidase family protein [Paracoccaceae bacterium]
MILRLFLIISVSAIMISGCQGIGSGALRNGIDRQPDTAGDQVAAPRPQPDGRGVISYPNYQVIVANGGETMAELAGRVGMTGAALARHNGLPESYRPRRSEVLALPEGIVAPATDPSAAGIDTSGLENIASAAIMRSDGRADRPTAMVQPGQEPIRHVVEPGETAYSIARLYDVSVDALAGWNGLGKDREVRNRQLLLIPVVADGAPRRDMAAVDTAPGQGSPTPYPPSSVTPLPAPEEITASVAPQSPNLVAQRTAGSNVPKMQRPVDGKVLRDYSSKPGGNEGIDFAATKGTAVKAADDGEVALVSGAGANTKIVLIRHTGNVYTVYSNVNDVPVKKGESVVRGTTVGRVAGGSPGYVRFEIRKGTESVDPAPYF